MNNLFKRILFVLLTGFHLTYFSELLFRSGLLLEPASTYVGIWLYYSFVGFVMLLLVNFFKANHIWSIFLVGALYGWILEGILFPNMYDPFPAGIAWTGLGWHALIALTIGWFYILKLLNEDNQQGLWAISALLGLIVGLFSMGWAGEEPVLSIGEYAIYNIVITALFVVSLAALSTLGEITLPISARSVYITGGSLLIFYAFIALQIPGALFIFPAVIIPTSLTLFMHRRAQRVEDKLPTISMNLDIELPKLFPLSLLAIVPIIIFSAGSAADFPIESFAIIEFTLIPAGVILWVVSVIQILSYRAKD